ACPARPRRSASRRRRSPPPAAPALSEQTAPPARSRRRSGCASCNATLTRMAIEIVHPDGRVELSDDLKIEHSPLYNHDLAPVRVADRNWSTYNFAALWISMAHCIPTYMLASGLMDKGMSWGQALVTILLGNCIVLVPILLNSHPGTKYGIPFPVFARASFGVYGSNLPALLRALVACGWFGIQSWIGGQAVFTFMPRPSPRLPGPLRSVRCPPP